MPDASDLQEAARILQERLGDEPYLTVTRAEISDLVRSISNDGATRLGKRMSAHLRNRLERLGVRMFPALDDTSQHTLRLFPTGGLVSSLVDVLLEPQGTDEELGDYIARLSAASDRPRGSA